MSKPEFDQEEPDNKAMFDFLDEDAANRSQRTPKRATDTSQPLPVIRKPVPVAESGALRAPIHGQKHPSQPEETAFEDDSDFGFLSEEQDTDQQLRQKRGEFDFDDDWRDGVYGGATGYDYDNRPSHKKRWLLWLVSALMFSAGVALFAMDYFARPTQPIVANVDDERAVGETELESVPTGSDTTVNEIITEVAAEKTLPSLGQRFRSELEIVEGLLAENRLDEAQRWIDTMDRSIYGYGAPEFDEISSKIRAIQNGSLTLEQVLSPENTELQPDTSEVSLTESSIEAEQERITAEKAQAEQLAAQKTEQERIAAEKAQAELLTAQKAEQERIAAEKARADQLAAQQAEQERIAAERAQAEQLAAQQKRIAAEQTRAEQITANQQRVAAEEAAATEAERARAVAREAAGKRAATLAAERQAAQTLANADSAVLLEAKRKAAEQADADRKATDKQAARQRAERDKAQNDNAGVVVETPRTISDEDLQRVYGDFTTLEQAVENGQITDVIAITQRSGSRVQQFMQLFANSDAIDARIANVATRNASDSITGTLRLSRATRADGTEVAIPAGLSTIKLTSTREGSGWSLIDW
ncbi:MAG: hypothetical protein V3U76_00710 [Granulosicoccus sp.]